MKEISNPEKRVLAHHEGINLQRRGTRQNQWVVELWKKPDMSAPEFPIFDSHNSFIGSVYRIGYSKDEWNPAVVYVCLNVNEAMLFDIDEAARVSAHIVKNGYRFKYGPRFRP